MQPVYVQSSSGTQFPLLRKVLVAFGDEVGFADTLDEALDQVFAGDSGVDAGDADGPTTDEVPSVDPEDPGTGDSDGGTPEPSAEPSASPGAGSNQALNEALQEAKDAMVASDEALKAGDFTAYGKAQERLRKAVEAAIAAEEATS